MTAIRRAAYLLILCLVMSYSFGQYHWKLTRNKDGIKVYVAENPRSKYKSIKVECILPGDFDRLIHILTDIDHLKDWVYNTKLSYLIKKISAYDLYYYTETSIPWPMSNRDVVVHLRILKDTLGRALRVTSINENRLVPEKDGKVRVVYSSINWYVTMLAGKGMGIVYTFEADPGGSLPAWLVNSFADKGPYESFKKLSEILSER